MDSLLYWPYEEVEIKTNNSKLHITCPWLKVSLGFEASESEVQSVLDILEEGPSSLEDIQKVNALLDLFTNLPIFYVVPRPLPADKELGGYQLDDEIDSHWNIQEIVDEVKTPEGLVDPIALFSHLRKLQILDVMQMGDSGSLTKAMKEVSKDKEMELLAYALRQNHYVTQRCQEVISPAEDLHSGCAPLIREFLEDEKDHDLLLQRSFEHLGINYADVPVGENLVKLMDHFKFLAENNIVALATLIDVFERSGKSEENPMIVKLKELGQDEAAKPLEAHLNINEDGDHDQAGIELLAPLGAISEDYAKKAVALFATASELIVLFNKERTAVINQ